MSNPAVYALSETTINSLRIRIEDNLGESIHVHIGAFRIALSVDEFNNMVDQIQMGANELLKLSGFNFDMFDKKSFDWDWLYRYEKIEKIEKINVKIKDLLTKGELQSTPALDIIVPISESRQYKALNSNYEELDRYNEVNEYGVSNRERLNMVFSSIREKGYPYDEKYILVNQFNQIYDGDHRAACLLYLRGENAEIPVIKITFQEERTIEEQLASEQDMIEKYIEKEKNKLPPVRNWSEELNVLDIDFKIFINMLDESCFDYYSLEHFWSYENGEKIADKIIVIEENRMIDFCKWLKISYFGKCIYRRYHFLYSMQRCVYIELKDSKILVFDRLCCKSKFENAILPLDKKIQVYGRKNVLNHKPDLRTEMIYVITNALLNGNGFEQTAKVFIRSNSYIFDDFVFLNLIERVFFNYTDRLLKYLTMGEFDTAYKEYLVNEDY